MSKKFYLIILLTGLALASARAQQQFQMSQYFMSPITFNPAVTGVEDFVDLKVGFRQQWSGFEDAPRTYFISASGTLNSSSNEFLYKGNSLRISDPSIYDQFRGRTQGKIKHGIGGYIVRDQQGPFRQMGGYVAYAPHFSLGPKATLAVGVSGGLSNREWNIGDISVREPDDNTYNNYLTQGVIENYFDLNAGVFFYTNTFYIGYSANQLLQNKVYAGQENIGKLTAHHYLTAGYRIPLNSRLDFLPSVLLKYVSPVPPVLDINLKVKYNEVFWAGVSYRNNDAIAGMAGATLNQFINLSYSYDFTISDFNAYNTGSHEIILGLMLFNKTGATPYLW